MTQLDVAGAAIAADSATWLRLPCCEAAVHPVSIGWHEADRVEIAAPRAPHSETVEIPDADVVVLLGWSDAGGTFVLSCHVELESSTVDQWTLVVDGDGDFFQRRQHVRVATTAPVQLLDHRRDVPVPGTMLDLSEGGMRCVFNEWLFEGDDDKYRVAIRLQGLILVVEATPMWSGRGEGEEVFVGFSFDTLHHSVLARIRSQVAQTLASSTGRLA